LINDGCLEKTATAGKALAKAIGIVKINYF